MCLVIGMFTFNLNISYNFVKRWCQVINNIDYVIVKMFPKYTFYEIVPTPMRSRIFSPWVETFTYNP
jgi:hypothetical protein